MITRTVDVTANDITIRITNTKTGKSDVYHLDVSEQGSSYHMLLSREENGRKRGLHGIREMVDAIGEEERAPGIKDIQDPADMAKR